MMRRILLSILILMLCCVLKAQSYNTYENPRGKNMGLNNSSTKGMMLDSKIGVGLSVPSGYRGYSDEDLEEFNKKMREKEWDTEQGAWKRACEMDTRHAYEKYMAMYPNGAHVSEADVRCINARIAETLNGAHNSLPNIKHTQTDDDAMTSTLVIENNTDYPLTVYYSGTVVKSVLIPVGGRTTFSVENGEYKLAASVPPEHIKPYAGKTEFVGGRYEMGFWVVSR